MTLMIKTRKGRTKIRGNKYTAIQDLYQINHAMREALMKRCNMTGYEAYRLIQDAASVCNFPTRDAMYTIFEGDK